MHRNDKSRFLLYIEPKKEEKSSQPVDDNVTLLLTMALRKSKRGASNYSSLDAPERFSDGAFKGFHRTDCGETSDNCDHLLENDMITNSLAPFYARWYRNSIQRNDWEKIENLAAFYGMDISSCK